MPHQRFDDDQAHRAEQYLASVLGGECASEVRWDGDHHLQGHLNHSGTHFVVIAPHDDQHDPIVMSETSGRGFAVATWRTPDLPGHVAGRHA